MNSTTVHVHVLKSAAQAGSILCFFRRIIYLWGMEWEVLSQTFGFDVEIKIVSDVFEEKCVYSISPGGYDD